MSVLDDLASALVTGAGLTLGTDLFLGAMLETHPDECTVLYESAGLPDGHTFGGSGAASSRQASVQVRTRAEVWDYVGARARAEAAYAVLTEVANTDLGGTRYLRAEHVNGPAPIGRDSSDRWEFVANFVVSWLP